MAKTTQIEPFAAYAALERGILYLGVRTHRKTMSVEWHDGSMLGYEKFNALLDCDAMHAELLEIWRRHLPQACSRVRFSHGGGSSGHMFYVPVDAGAEAVDAVRKHFTAALETLADVALPDRLTEARDAVAST